MNIPSPNIPVFDTAVMFDTAEYYIKIDLSPSIILNGAGLSVDVVVVKPNGDRLSATPFYPATLTDTYRVALPMMAGVIMWGTYRIIAILNIAGVAAGTVDKKFNLCAPEKALSNSATGHLQIDADCARGTVKLSGLTGYSYKGMEASLEERNVTYFYPAEAEIFPVKNITNLPIELPGYTGINIVKGSLVSEYAFKENIGVRVRYIAVETKDVRCGYDLSKIYCALDEIYRNTPASDLCDLMCQVSPLLFLITIGLGLGMDVDDKIGALEKILGTDCRCCSSAGTRLSTSIRASSCHPVDNLRAMLSASTLVAMFDTDKLSASAMLQVRYRDASIANSPWTESPEIVPTYHINQDYSFTVTDTTKQYEVSVIVTCCDGQLSEKKVKTTPPTGVICPSISGAIVEGYATIPVTTGGGSTGGNTGGGNTGGGATPPTDVTVYWAWSIVDPHISPETSNDGLPPVWQSKTIQPGANIDIDYTQMPDYRYPLLKVPSSESIKNFFSDSGSIYNNDFIPGDVYRAAFTLSGYTYYTTYQPYSYSKTAGALVTFSIK